MRVSIKLTLVILLLGCLLKLPYGYFQFVRIVFLAGFFLLCYSEHREGRTILSLLCGVAAIVFNPFFLLPFSRSAWYRIDLYLAIAICVWILYDLIFDPKSLKKMKW